MKLRALALSAASLLLLAACGGSEGGSAGITAAPDAPSVRAANALQAATVGVAFRYDATQGGAAFSDPAGKGLTYSVSFLPLANGLAAAAGVVTGSPTTPAVTTLTITATDALGRTATDRFAIVSFASGLVFPSLPESSEHYSDSTTPLSRQFLIDGPDGSVLATDNTPATNPVTDAGATLGRVLFYDPRLSANDGTSCASCHIQSLGFSDSARFSRGFNGVATDRHSSGLVNARFYKRGRFFWDERAASLEAQVVTPIQDITEMGLTLDALTLKLAATSYYRPLFASAFGTSEITSDRVARALAQYVRSIVSGGSRFDRAFAAAGPPNFASVFTAQEQQGERLFQSAGCARCHATIAQVSDDVHNIGLDATNTADAGAGNGRFKSPSLRNAAVRPRYMHDGRFTTLAQVVEFYDTGVQPNPALDPRLVGANGAPLRLSLTLAEREAIVAFMRTLTDSTLLTARRFSNPFVR